MSQKKNELAPSKTKQGSKHPELAFPSCAPTVSIRTKEDQICPGLSAMEKAMWRLPATIR